MELPLNTAHLLWTSPGSSEVEGIDEAERSGTSGTTGGQVTGEEPPELLIFVYTTKEDLQDWTHGENAVGVDLDKIS